MLLAGPEAVDGYDCLYISPHRDDAALSCMGRMLADRKRGLRILVVGLFEGSGTASAAHVAATLGGLGADYVVSGLPPAARRHPDAAFSSLAYGRRPDDEAWEDEVTGVLSRLGPRTRALHIYAPLAVGTHIDHRLAHDAALRAFGGKAGRNMFFYEERPEAFAPGAVRVRLGVLGARLPPAAAAAEAAGLARHLVRFHVAPSMRGEFRGWADRVRSAGGAFRQWREARPWNPLRAFGPRLQPVLQPVEADALGFLRDAVAALAPAGASGARFADRFARLARSYGRRLAGAAYAERYWLLLPSPDEAQLPAAVGQD